jgi:DNA mismatch endonuclease (patch repair protein)
MALSRSEQMARIRGRETRPEVRLRSALHGRGMRFRVGLRTGHGRADIVFTRRRIAVFVDGCFWHGCPDHYVRPRTREAFWAKKLKGNVGRDRRQTLALEREGWTVLRFWEHEVVERLDRVVGEIADRWRGGSHRTRRELRVECVEPVNPSGTRESWQLVDLRDDAIRRCVERPRSPHRA